VLRISSGLFGLFLSDELVDKSNNIINNTFHYMSHGLDVHQGCSPVLERNVYKRDESSGQQPAMKFT